MTDSQAFAVISETTGLSKAEVKRVVEQYGELKLSALKDGLAVGLCGLVRLRPKYMAAKPKRKGINPFTQEEQMFAAKPASLSAKASVAKRVKDAMPSPTSKAGKAIADALSK